MTQILTVLESGGKLIITCPVHATFSETITVSHERKENGCVYVVRMSPTLWVDSSSNIAGVRKIVRKMIRDVLKYIPYAFRASWLQDSDRAVKNYCTECKESATESRKYRRSHACE